MEILERVSSARVYAILFILASAGRIAALGLARGLCGVFAMHLVVVLNPLVTFLMTAAFGLSPMAMQFMSKAAEHCVVLVSCHKKMGMHSG